MASVRGGLLGKTGSEKCQEGKMPSALAWATASFRL